MPLSKAADREPIHHRAINCRGFRRLDDLWDIEGHLVDVKNYPFQNTWRGEIHPGEPLHEMWIRMTVDDDLVIVDIEAVTDNSPFPECPDIPQRFHLLKGVRIAPGWTRKIRKQLSGVNSCTHLVELLGPMATTAFQTIYPLINMKQQKTDESIRPPLINSCHAFASDGDVVRRQWPAFYTGDDTDITDK